jgi:uncharacterized membrane protein (UPF0127 family)
MAQRALALLLLALACAAAAAPEVVFVRLGQESFTLEVALDPARRLRGLSGRREIARHEGLLFVLPRPQPFAMVMRDCPVPIDVAFLDAQGRVAAIHEMRVEPPRGAGESPADYERRLPLYPSGGPVLFAIETAGGRLREVGLSVGDRVGFDGEALVSRAR